MRSPLNRTTAPQVLKLLDYCFKQGVLDACELGDDYSARDWMEARKEDGGYGLLSDIETPYDWRRWRFTLFRWCRNARMGSIGETYIDRICKVSNFLFCVVPISMRFYLMGIEEWLEYPNHTNIQIFKQNRKVHWKPVAPHLRVITKDDFISYIQDFVYERHKFHKRIQEDCSEEEATAILTRDASDKSYNNFVKAVWALTRPSQLYAELRNYEEDDESL
jgi:hypothetical protein